MEWWILIITIKKGRDRGASIVFSDVREGDKSIASCIISVYRVGVRWGGWGMLGKVKTLGDGVGEEETLKWKASGRT